MSLIWSPTTTTTIQSNIRAEGGFKLKYQKHILLVFSSDDGIGALNITILAPIRIYVDVPIDGLENLQKNTIHYK